MSRDGRSFASEVAYWAPAVIASLLVSAAMGGVVYLLLTLIGEVPGLE